jgi:hypothetical protein
VEGLFELTDHLEQRLAQARRQSAERRGEGKITMIA